jgi:hypothetical protein
VGRERIVGRVLGFKMIEQPGEAMAEVENVRVAFPDFGHVWNAAPSELELEIAALSIVIGARVKVRATVARAPADAPLHASAHHGALASPQVRSTVARPRCSWPDGVDHRSVGSVRRVMPDGVCFVRFAVSPRWLSFDLAELEAASTEDEATAQAAQDRHGDCRARPGPGPHPGPARVRKNLKGH